MQENELQQVTGGFGMFGEHNPIFGKPRSKDDTTLFGKPRVKGEGSLGEASDA